jgi:hypothetical protein
MTSTCDQGAVQPRRRDHPAGDELMSTPSIDTLAGPGDATAHVAGGIIATTFRVLPPTP